MHSLVIVQLVVGAALMLEYLSSGDAVQRHQKSNSTNIIIHLHNTTEEEEEAEAEGDG